MNVNAFHVGDVVDFFCSGVFWGRGRYGGFLRGMFVVHPMGEGSVGNAGSIASLEIPAELCRIVPARNNSNSWNDLLADYGQRAWHWGLRLPDGTWSEG